MEGTVDADALPASPKVRPAAPKAGTAALVTRFLFFEVCFTSGILASSIPSLRIVSIQPRQFYAA